MSGRFNHSYLTVNLNNKQYGDVEYKNHVLFGIAAAGNALLCLLSPEDNFHCEIWFCLLFPHIREKETAARQSSPDLPSPGA